MSVAPYHHDALSCSTSANNNAISNIKNDLFSEHIPAQKSRSLMDTANVKVGESVTLGKKQMALLAARDIYRPGEVIYLEFIPIQRVYSKPTKYTFRKDNHVHLDSVGGVRYVNHSFTPNARVYFPCCGFCKDRGYFIGLEVLEPITKGQEIRVDYTKTEKEIANRFCDAATGKHIS